MILQANPFVYLRLMPMELAQLIRTRRAPKPSAAETLDILFATNEVAPYSKSGGLADVAASLPKALNALGHRVSIITPLYPHLDPAALHLSRRLQPLQVPRLGKSRKKVDATIWEGRTEGGVRIFFIEQDEFFGQDGPLNADSDAQFQNFPARFAFFGRAIVEFALQYSVPVDVIHCNDWHTALAPVFRNQYYAEEMKKVACVLTIHNLAVQGRFPADAMDETGLPKKYFVPGALRQGEAINYLQAGIANADRVTTVSPTYAAQIQTPQAGFGLDEILRNAADKLTGILNGADYSVWSPDIDHFLKIHYDIERLNGKRQNKAAIQHQFGLPIRPTLPLLAYIGRLNPLKGIDLLLPALDKLLAGFQEERDSFQMVFLAEGDKKYAERVQKLAQKYPRNVAAHIGYSEELAHKFQAAADLLLVPSKFEPCGLTQLYAMKYGTLPIVHATGGLMDTVLDPTREDATGDGTALSTGFMFHEFTEDALRDTIERATTRYRHYRKWRPLIQNAMEQDFSWGSSAAQYIDVYNRALGKATPAPAQASTQDLAPEKSKDTKELAATAEAAPAAKKSAATKSRTEQAEEPAAKPAAAKKASTKTAAPKNATSEDAAPEKAAPNKAAARKTRAKENDAETSNVDKGAAKKSAATKTDAQKVDAQKSPAKKPRAKKADAKTADTAKADAEKADAEKADAAKPAAAKKTAAKAAAPKKAATKKTAPAQPDEEVAAPATARRTGATRRSKPADESQPAGEAKAARKPGRPKKTAADTEANAEQTSEDNAGAHKPSPPKKARARKTDKTDTPTDPAPPQKDDLD